MPPELHLSRRHRVDLVLEGALAGIATGVVISAYRFFLSHAEELLRHLTGVLADGGVRALLWVPVLGILCLVVGRLMLYEPYTQASGIPQIDAEVAGRVDMPWRRVLPVKFVEGVLCAFAGLSLGREGPSVLLGGMAAKGVARIRKDGRPRERLLVTCGAAAGMSAAFHAPLTGVLFAVEEIHREFSAALVISVMTASIVSDFVASQLLGVAPLIHFVEFGSLPHELYLSVLLMGAICGLAGFLHNRGMFAVQERIFDPISHFVPYARLAVPFAVAGVVAFVWPDLMCGGDAIIERVLSAREEPVVALALLLVGKYVFTSICFGSGAPGGTLFPLVVMGSLVGALYGHAVISVAGIPGLYENSFVALGIAGLFASVIQAPVTAVVLVFELTGSLEALLATSVVSIVSYVVATLLGTQPYYEHLYERMLGHTAERDATEDAKTHKVIRNYVVGAGSAAEGRLIKDVPWPEDTLVITVRKAGHNLIANGGTVLEALDVISIVMDESVEPTVDTTLRLLFVARD
ncbi:MAG: chloride channel protein [Atopobiaceae bacterium]|nr:chloride channel protein [Atopobiaceae bacterium]